MRVRDGRLFFSGIPAVGGGPAGRGRGLSLSRRVGEQALFLALLVASWEVLARWKGGLLFPTPSDTLLALAQLLGDGILAGAFLQSNLAFVIGYAITLVGGTLAGLSMGSWRAVDRLLAPYLQMLLVTPVVAVVPVIVILLGLTLPARVAVVVMFSLPFLVSGVRAGVRGVDPETLEMCRSFRVPRGLLWFWVILPGALPGLLAGVWSSLGPAVSGMIMAELTIVAAGLGGLMRQSMDRFDAPALFGVTLVLALEGLLLTGVARLLEARLTRSWNR